jgi:arylsulfatase A-like enzyme
MIASLLISCNISKKETGNSQKPNIVYILADDLGYAELGCYGQTKIETPNIDELSANGLIFTQHYAGAPVCAPSRCALLTGKHMGNAYIRGNDELDERGDVWNFAKAVEDPQLEGQRPLPTGTITIAGLLKNAGYKTGMVGKWGLGAPLSKGIPNNMGFDFFYGFNCQRQAHTYYPKHLWKNKEKVWLENDIVVPGTKLDEGADPYDEDSYKKFNQKDYAPDLMHIEALNFINKNKDNPFFLYYASSLPHVALQAPKHWIDYYVKKFGDEEPFDGIPVDGEIGDTEPGYFPCRYPKATYAAMVSCLDEEVGELVAELKKLGIYKNTLIIFVSDNGATYDSGTNSFWFDSSKPFKSKYRWGKEFLHEGGIRVPMIASWPTTIEPGMQTDHISAFWDIMPTFCDIAGIEKPANIDGISFLPELKGEKQQKHEYLYWEFSPHGGQQAVRFGKWKAIRKNIHEGNMAIELYDLENDIQEQHDVALQFPEIVDKIKDMMKEAHKPSPISRFRMESLQNQNEIIE